jgi:hypothetical protein
MLRTLVFLKLHRFDRKINRLQEKYKPWGLTDPPSVKQDTSLLSGCDKFEGQMRGVGTELRALTKPSRFLLREWN